MKVLIYIFTAFFIAQPAIAEFVCTSTTTAAEIFADSDKTCTTDAEVMRVTLKSGEFYNANTDNKFGSDSASTWVLKSGDMSGDIGGASTINYLPNLKKSQNKPGTYTHFRGYLSNVITVKGGITTAGSPTLSCVTAGATSNVFAMADTSCGDGTCITDVNDKAEVEITLNDLDPGGSDNYLYSVNEGGLNYDVELMQSDGSTRATSSGNVDHLRAIIALPSAITITKNTIVDVQMYFKGTNALAVTWNGSAASGGCAYIANVAPVFSVTVTVTEP
tara:strand:- start:65700 stop:66527 length:828 start_codon:yes stop_codon:yes gene_type:complete